MKIIARQTAISFQPINPKRRVSKPERSILKFRRVDHHALNSGNLVLVGYHINVNLTRSVGAMNHGGFDIGGFAGPGNEDHTIG